MTELLNAQWSGVMNPEELGLNGYGSLASGLHRRAGNARFTRRLGGNAADFFYSGTFTYEDLTIGYIRIPNYAPTSTAAALTQFEREIAFFNANTDGLIVDEMRNTGGNLCYGESIAARLIPDYFRATGFRLRPFWSRIIGFYNAWINAKAAGAPPGVIDQYETAVQSHAGRQHAGPDHHRFAAALHFQPDPRSLHGRRRQRPRL